MSAPLPPRTVTRRRRRELFAAPRSPPVGRDPVATAPRHSRNTQSPLLCLRRCPSLPPPAVPSSYRSLRSLSCRCRDSPPLPPAGPCLSPPFVGRRRPPQSPPPASRLRPLPPPATTKPGGLASATWQAATGPRTNPYAQSSATSSATQS
ncbi:uncharacterized protein LOC131875178 [Cryptomeria japonica]|uniref:uncharacterized protein LOC131875178 n=1 Tax=Cryptomeria japonica TaxID=3369 RepID=UPI0027DA6CE3|nr:uncharacterized protein LOC131875178 [Cryptomeria japonica]